MSVPFSNTHLRIPRGFGTILEGLAREILRDQPEDIPKYAAQYFDVLLKQREECNIILSCLLLKCFHQTSFGVRFSVVLMR
uniref:Sperm autoantigenic protein 17 n=1 Tax=Seriola lalandi dorsalis TaxID=1841481 RepID=A0A3B4XBC9_SERLL